MKARTLLFSLLLITGIISKGISQHTYAEWVKNIVAEENTAFLNIISDGDAIIANGYWFLQAEYDGLELPYHVGSNALIVKKDFEGNIIWHSTMTGDNLDTFFDIALDSDNNIIAVGWSSSNEYIEINGVTAYLPDMEWTSRGIVAKFSGEDGSLIWSKIINPNEEYFELSLTKVAVDAEDNIYISGSANTSFEIEGVQFPYTQEGWGSLTYMAKLDPSGSIVWGNQFHFVEEGDAGWSMPRTIEIINNEIYYSFQYSKPVNVGDDVLPYEGEGYFDWIGLVKLSTLDAQVIKTNSYGSSSDQNIASLEIDNNGNVLVAGFFTSDSDFNINGVSPMAYGTEDGYVAKLNNEFELIWLRSMGSEFSSRCFNLTISNDNRIFVGGGFDSYTPMYFEGSKLIDEESPTNSLAMFQVVMNDDGEFEKAFALHGEDIYSIVEYKDAVLLDNDILMVVGQSLDYVNFVEDNKFFSEHWAGFLMKWDLSKEFYKIIFEVKDEDGNALDNAIVTLEGTSNPFNTHSFYQIDPGVYGYSVTLEGYDTIEGEVEVINQSEVVPITMIQPNTSVNDLNSVALSLFPNPTNGIFTITTNSVIEEIIISDAIGRMVHKQLVGKNSTQVDTHGLPSGLYLVRINTRDGIATRKIQVIQ